VRCRLGGEHSIIIGSSVVMMICYTSDQRFTPRIKRPIVVVARCFFLFGRRWWCVCVWYLSSRRQNTHWCLFFCECCQRRVASALSPGVVGLQLCSFLSEFFFGDLTPRLWSGYRARSRALQLIFPFTQLSRSSALLSRHCGEECLATSPILASLGDNTQPRSHIRERCSRLGAF
jgi:hypothetical protein